MRPPRGEGGDGILGGRAESLPLCLAPLPRHVSPTTACRSNGQTRPACLGWTCWCCATSHHSRSAQWADPAGPPGPDATSTPPSGRNGVRRVRLGPESLPLCLAPLPPPAPPPTTAGRPIGQTRPACPGRTCRTTSHHSRLGSVVNQGEINFLRRARTRPSTPARFGCCCRRAGSGAGGHLTEFILP